MLAQQGNHKRHARNRAFLNKGFKAEGIAFQRRRGVSVGYVARLLEVDDISVDDGAHGTVLGNTQVGAVESA